MLEINFIIYLKRKVKGYNMSFTNTGGSNKMTKKELKRIKIISSKPKVTIKQKHTIGNSYNNVCSRNCYKINKLQQWSYCECIRIARKIALNNPKVTFIA